MAITLEDLKKATSDQLLTIVDRRHPEYEANLDHWKFLQATHDGGREWFEDNLWRYHKEGIKEYRARKKRAYRFPHTREVVNLVNKYVLKGDIARAEEAPEQLKRFWKNATLMKRSVETLMDSISRKSSTFGRVYVVVDNNFPSDVKTKADEKRSRGRVYAYVVSPIEALDFAYDDDGELSWFLLAETKRDDASPLASGAVATQFRIWAPDFWAVISVAKNENGDRIATIADSDEHQLGAVPVVPVDHNPSEELYVSPSLIDDVAYMDRGATNYLSNLDAIIQDQTFSQLAIPYQGLLEQDNDDTGKAGTQKQMYEMGTKRVFAYNAEGGSAPMFLSPDPRQAGIIVTVIAKIIDEIYHSIGMAGERTKSDNSVGIDNSSGVAKAYDFERLNAMLVAKAQALAAAENAINRLVLGWFGKLEELEDTKEFVSYPTTFDVRNLADDMDNAQRLAVMNAPKSLRRIQMKKLSAKMYPQIPAEQKREIEKDIDDEWLAEPDPAELVAGAAGRPAAPKPGRVPGQKGEQGQNNKGSVKADDKAKAA
jgi:hypothetical protein